MNVSVINASFDEKGTSPERCHSSLPFILLYQIDETEKRGDEVTEISGRSGT